MIENMEQLLDVMESAALRQSAHIERTAYDPVARPLDMRQCIFAALVAAQTEGTEMMNSKHYPRAFRPNPLRPETNHEQGTDSHE